jgi:hypothetical protein
MPYVLWCFLNVESFLPLFATSSLVVGFGAGLKNSQISVIRGMHASIYLMYWLMHIEICATFEFQNFRFIRDVWYLWKKWNLKFIRHIGVQTHGVDIYKVSTCMKLKLLCISIYTQPFGHTWGPTKDRHIPNLAIGAEFDILGGVH